jgi:hypothetical protein
MAFRAHGTSWLRLDKSSLASLWLRELVRNVLADEPKLRDSGW